MECFGLVSSREQWVTGWQQLQYWSHAFYELHGRSQYIRHRPLH